MWYAGISRFSLLSFFPLFLSGIITFRELSVHISLEIYRPLSPHLLSIHPLPPSNPFALHHPTPRHPPSLPGRLQIGYFLHAPSRALIRGRVLIVGLSLRLTDSSGCAAEMPDLVNVCLWGLISTPYINCLDSMCRQSLSILLHPPTTTTAPPSILCLYLHSLSIPASHYSLSTSS